MQVSVVGAGITGCVTAYSLCKKGFGVTIYESSDHIGGTLRDVEYENQVFFNACQYLNASAQWIHDLSRDNHISLMTFDHIYGSITETEDRKTICTDYAGPSIVPTNIENFVDQIKEKRASDSPCIQSRFERYPEEVSSFLKTWFGYHNHDLNKLHESAATTTQCSRIYAQGHDGYVVDEKRKNHHVDELIAVPRSQWIPDDQPLCDCLPTHGFNLFFEEMKEILISEGCTIRLSSPVKARCENKSVSITTRSEAIKTDLVVWTSNPTPLILNAGLGKLDTPVWNAKVYFYEMQTENVIAPCYIQVFSTLSPISRVFVYNLGGKNKITVEVIASNDNSEMSGDAILHKTKEILQQYNYCDSIVLCGSEQQNRFVFYTTEDFIRFQKFDKMYGLGQGNLIAGAWTEYGRDQKIIEISRRISSWMENQH